MVKTPRQPRGGKRPAARGGTVDADMKDAPPARQPAAAGTAKPAAARSAKPSAAKSGKAAPPKAGARAKPAGTMPRRNDGPRGFGGWLWLLAIGQLVVTARMIDTLSRMGKLVGTELWADHPGLVTADLALYGVALVLQLGVLAAMALGRRLFVPLFIVSIVVYFLIGRTEPLLAIRFLGMDPGQLLSRAALMPMAIELAVGLAWGAYVLRSRRVKNTFVR